jgi:predicted metal-dependent phosphoesterase TrpH
VITELHCHTTASDGQLAPADVVKLAKQRDVSLLAITDHDTIAAHDEALAAGAALNLRVIPGIEVSSLSPQGEVHVLGYNVRPTDEATIRTLNNLRDVREARARGMIDKLAALGVQVPFERVQSLAGDAMIGRPHLARVLVEMKAVSNMQEAFDRYLAEGKPAFVPHEGLTPAQAVALIHAAHGIAVLAHPALYRGDLDALLQDMLAAGLDGLEVFYPMHTPAQIEQFKAIAQKHNLVMTGGSDFHALIGDQPASIGTVHVPEECLRELDARMQARASRRD